MADVNYSARFAGPELLQQSRANVLTCPVYRDNALVVPSAGTCTVYRADGTVVETGASSNVASIATYTTGTLSTETRGEGWRVVWVLTLASVSTTFDRMASLCRRRLFPVVTDADLLRKHSDLTELRPSGLSSYQSKIDDCWEELVHDLRQKGSIPHLVMAAEDLKFVLMYRVLASVYYDFAQGNPTWLQRASDYKLQAKAAFDGLTFSYDTSDTGTQDALKRSASPVTILGGGGDYRYWGTYGNY